MAFASRADELFYGGASGGGKLQPLDSLVATPYSFRQMGDLKVGDRICDAFGGNTEIIGVFPQGKKQLYRFTFQDGSSTEVGGEHLWKYSVAGHPWRKSRKRWKLATTLQLMEMMRTGRRILIPLTLPVQFTKSYRHDYRRIPPYVLGALLGDGAITRRVSLHTADGEIARYIFGLTSDDWYYDGDLHYCARGATGQELQHWLAKLDLMGKRSWEKFIPECYKYGIIEDRFALLRGLMDTDGYCTKDGKAYFTSTSEQLAKDVQWLVWSLGGRATITSKVPTYSYKGKKRKGREAFGLYVRMPENVVLFSLQRKKALAGEYNGGGKILKRRIVSIEPSRTAEAQCIKIADPSGLYLTDDFVVTHNTDLLIGLGATQGKNTIILRRTYPQLKGIFERCYELFSNTGAKFNKQDKIWRGLPGNRILEFGAIQYESDKNNYRGRPHDIWCWDEITEFTKSQYEFVSIWARSVDPAHKVRIVVAGNPPNTVEGEWVLERWAAWLDDTHPNPAEPGELRWYARVDDKEIECADGEPFEHNGEIIEPLSRTFIPADVEDNLFLRDTGYKARLQMLPEPLRSRFLYGIMSSVLEGNPWQVIPVEWVKLAQRRWKETEQPNIPMSALGVDVARGGADKTVLARRYGTWFALLSKYPGRDTRDGQAVVDLITPIVDRDIEIMIDIIGVGTSPYDLLKKENYNVTPMNAGAKSHARDQSGLLKFRDKRTEWWWYARHVLDPANGFEICLPDDAELRAELCAPKWGESGGIIKVEPKEKIKKRLGRSTDCADAVIMALAGGFKGRWVTMKPNQFHQDSRWTPPKETRTASRWLIGGGDKRSRWRR